MVRTVVGVVFRNRVVAQSTPSNPATLGTNQSVLIAEVASFQGELVLNIELSYFGTFQSGLNIHRGGHISGVQIRGSSL